jgi:hypothetical protein
MSKKFSELTPDEYEQVLLGLHHPELLNQLYSRPGVVNIDGELSIEQFAGWFVMSQLSGLTEQEGSPAFIATTEELNRKGRGMAVRLQQVLGGEPVTGNIVQKVATMTQEQRDQIDRVKGRAKRQIWVTFRKEGIHKYPAALTDPRLHDVQFLGFEHRHIFHFQVWIDVFHNDRDIEFIQFKRWLENLYAQSTLTLDYKSCEMIADDLYDQIAAKFPDRDVTISVAEDNENGCTINYNRFQPQQISV